MVVDRGFQPSLADGPTVVGSRAQRDRVRSPPTTDGVESLSVAEARRDGDSPSKKILLLGACLPPQSCRSLRGLARSARSASQLGVGVVCRGTNPRVATPRVARYGKQKPGVREVFGK